jgi:predicted TIM-barrel fold metal-dependent hydrolase
MSDKPTGGLGPLVDTHAHIYPRDTPLIEGATHQPSRDVTPEEYVRTLDEHGVLFGVHAAASFMGPYNDYTLAALARFPRLRGTAIVDPSIGLHELIAMDAAGIVGIRFSLRNTRAPRTSVRSSIGGCCAGSPIWTGTCTSTPRVIGSPR